MAVAASDARSTTSRARSTRWPWPCDGHADARPAHPRVPAPRSPPATLRRRVDAEPSAALEAKLSALERLQERLDRLLAEMDQVVTTLQTVHAEILVTDGIEQGALAGQLLDLRTRVQLLSADLLDGEPAA